MTLLYNGVQYDVESEGDEMEAINIPEEEEDGRVVQVLNNSNDFEESYWRHQTIHTFLDECIKRKMLIRNPKIRSTKLFTTIHKEMKALGLMFKPITLIRKLDTMKTQFFLLREQNKKRTDPTIRPVKWPYYEKMQILFPDTTEVAKTPKLPSAKQQSKTPASQSKQKTASKRPVSIQKPAETNIESSVAQIIVNENSSSYLLPFTSSSKDKPNGTGSFGIESFKKQMLALETRRTVAAEQILTEIRKSNQIKRALLEVNIKLFEASKEVDDF